MQTAPSPVHPAELSVPPKTSTSAATTSPPDPPPVDGALLLKQISDFLARCLHCSEHQRTVLALWIMQSHCFCVTRVTPYLHIRSRRKQSGKTLCLQLLALFCQNAAPTIGFTTAALTRRTGRNAPTILLDECQAVIGTRSRPKNPALRAILATGFEPGLGYTDATHERNIFSPKAFAGVGDLPDPLADRCIPIILEPLELESSNGKPKLERFHATRLVDDSRPISRDLERWGKENDKRLRQAPAYTYDEFPPGLTPRRQDLIEPLLRIADVLGGDWPRISREALMALFQQDEQEQDAVGLDFLYQLCRAFAHYGNPKRISTSALLEWLHAEPHQPWNQEGLINAHGLARLLLPFGIRPRVQRLGSTATARGYVFQDFVPLWARLFPNSTHEPVPDEKPPFGAACNDVSPDVTESDPYDPDDPVVINMERQGYRPFCPGDPGTFDLSVGRQRFITFGKNPAGDRRFRARRQAKYQDPPAASATVDDPGKKPAIGAECNDVSLAEQQRARAEYDAGIAKLRQMQQSLPACAEGYTRLAPIKR